MKKYLPFFILILLVAVIAISTYKISNIRDSSTTESEEDFIHFNEVKIDLPDFTLPDLYQENVSFSKKTLQKKYSVINFFASWCTTCRAEHDILLRLKNEGIIDIYGIAFRDIDVNTKDFLAKHGNPYTSVAKDSQGIFAKIIGLNAVPETIIVNQEGVVVRRHKGNLQEFSIDEIRDFLRHN
jgi:cytochrome c biogenesis protein CcmG/thiol:disulfide interchange protein DsbE